MKIFLDTARLDEIQQAVDWGVLRTAGDHQSLAAFAGPWRTRATRRLVIANAS